MKSKEIIHKSIQIMGSLAIALATGCASEKTVPLQPQTMAESFEQRSLNDPGLLDYLRHTAGVPQGGWTLDQLTRVGFYFSPSLDAARARLKKAESETRSAELQPNPALSVPLQYASAAMKPWTYGLTFDIPIDLGGKRVAIANRARALGDVARLELGQQAWQLRSTLRKNLLDLARTVRQSTLLDRQISLESDLVAMMQKRLTVGAVSANELAIEQGSLIKAQLLRSQLSEKHLNALTALADALGLPLEALQNQQFDFGLFEGQIPALPSRVMQHLALENRADMQIALARYKVQQAALQLAVARQYPDLSLGVGYLFDQGENKYSFTPTLNNLPVFHGNSGEIDQARAGLAEALASAEIVQQHALNACSQAIKSVQLAQENLNKSEQILSLQQRQAATANSAFQVGSQSRLEVVLAKRSANRAEIQQLSNWYTFQSAIGQLENTLQKPLYGQEGQQPEPDSPRQP